MLTKVILEGPMGKHFGREWSLDVNSPSEALRLIDANKPGLFNWIRANLKKYDRYRVVCEYENGNTEELTSDDYGMERKCKSIRFIPLVEGSGAVARIVVGIIIIIVACVFQQYYLVPAGVAMVVGGAIELMTSKPKRDQQQAERKDKTSYYFDGPTNTTLQGVPVQLVYGRCLVGSHSISAAIKIDQLM